MVKATKVISFVVLFISFLVWLFCSPSLRFFLSEHPGLIAVFIGVSGEVYFDWREEKGAHSRWKKFFMALLVVGLAYELFEASESDKKAADAIKSAGQANERASSNEVQVAELTSNNIALQLKLQPRIITPEQMKDFMFLTEKIPKFPIRVGVVGLGEQLNYAIQIRNMLNLAGFKTPDSDTNFMMGIYYDPTAVAWHNIQDTNPWADIEFDYDSTNFSTTGSVAHFEVVNGIKRWTVQNNETNLEYKILIQNFQAIGIKTWWEFKPSWTSPNHCGVFVAGRPY